MEKAQALPVIGKMPYFPPRASLFYLAVAIQLLASAISGVGFVLESPCYFLGGTFIWILWFAVMFQITSPRAGVYLHPHVRSLRRAASVLFVVLFLAGIAELVGMTGLYSQLVPPGESDSNFITTLRGLNTVFEYNDSTILVQQGSENLLEGKNPYAQANIIEGMIEFDGAPDRVSPLRVGRFADTFPYPSLQELEELHDEAVLDPVNPPPELESRFCYPAGAFLLPAPFIAMGIDDIRWILAGLAVAGLAYAVWSIPGKRKWLFIGGALISLEFWNSIGAGETSMLAFPLLMVAWLSLNRNRWLSLVFMGLAIATKQTAWFILPFYLALFLKTYGWRRVSAGFAIITGIFAGVNLPFIIADAGLWMHSIIAPMTDPLFPLGVGVITLVTSGLVDIRTALPFTVMEIVAGIVVLVWYYRNCREFPHMALVLAVVPLFFAWRSLWTYFFYVGIIAFAGVLSEADTKNPDSTEQPAR